MKKQNLYYLCNTEERVIIVYVWSSGIVEVRNKLKERIFTYIECLKRVY
jgi:hypothetical protein